VTITATQGFSFYGIADVGVSNVNTGMGNKLNVGSGGWLAPRLGVKGERDIGNGIKAVGVAEAGLFFNTGSVGNGVVTPGINETAASTGGATATGNQIFSRQIYAGLASSRWGSLTFGRQYSGSYASATYGNALLTNAYGYSGSLTATNGMPTRLNNSVTYFTPTVGGVTGQLVYSTGAQNNTRGDVPTAAGATNKTNDRAGKGYDLSVNYATKQIYAAASTWNVYNTSYVTGETALAKKSGWQLAGSYDFGVVKVVGTYAASRIGGGNYQNVTKVMSKTSAWSPSFSVPFGKSRVYASFTSFNDESLLDRDTKLYGVAYAYDLYENTKLYAAWGRQANNRNASYSLADGGNLVGNVTTPGTAVTGELAGIEITF
jgi:predicted porin